MLTVENQFLNLLDKETVLEQVPTLVKNNVEYAKKIDW